VAALAQAQPRADLDYTVPAGFRAVVRSISVSPSGTGTSAVGVTIQGLCYLYRNDAVAAGRTDHLECNQVVNAGEVISAFSEGGSSFVCISGFLLNELP